MTAPKWVTVEETHAAYSKQIRRFGGAEGVRDAGLLESALSRPQNLHAYNEDADLCDLAAAYGFGLAKNHPFVDGNKRTCFAVVSLFLGKNGLELAASEPELSETIVALASDKLSEEDFAQWLRANTRPRG